MSNVSNVSNVSLEQTPQYKTMSSQLLKRNDTINKLQRERDRIKQKSATIVLFYSLFMQLYPFFQ